MEKPYCIIVTGRPGSGKSTLAKEIAKLLHLPVLSRDEVKEGYVHTFGVPHDQLPKEANGIATKVFFDAADSMIESKVSIVLEAAFQHKVWSAVIPGWMERSHMRIIICSPPKELCAMRHLERGLSDPTREIFHGDQRVKTYRETGVLQEPGPYVEPDFECKTIHVNTENGYNPTIAELIVDLKLKLAQPVAGGDATR